MSRCCVFSLLALEDPLLGETLAMDVRIADQRATLADFLEELDAFAARHLADCRGCDACCQERAPLIAADVPALASLLPASPFPAHQVCAAFARISVDENGAADIILKRNSGNACDFLDPKGRLCREHPSRPFVCRSHFCLPRSGRIGRLRESIVNHGENELTRLLLAEEAIGAASLTPRPLAQLLDPADYQESPQRDRRRYRDILIKDNVSAELWSALTERAD